MATKLKYVYNTKEDVPEALRDFYEERDGKFVLLADDLITKDKLDKFREDAITARKDRDRYKELADKLEEAGLTLEEALRLKGIEGDLNDQKLFKKGEIDKIVQERLQETVKKSDKLMESLKNELMKLTRELETMRIDEAAVNVALKAGLEESAVDDIKSRARATFKLVDGKPKAIGFDGLEITDDRGDPLTYERWIQSLKPNAPHLFKRNAGGGGVPGRGAPGRIDESKNPFKKDEFNLTQQGRIYRENPEKAARMREAAAS
jgi:hypothetical protein